MVHGLLFYGTKGINFALRDTKNSQIARCHPKRFGDRTFENLAEVPRLWNSHSLHGRLVEICKIIYFDLWKNFSISLLENFPFPKHGKNLLYQGQFCHSSWILQFLSCRSHESRLLNKLQTVQNNATLFVLRKSKGEYN